MIVHARFRCDSVLQCENQATVCLQPVTKNNQGNEEWSKWTPNGSISLTVTVQETAKAFVPGKIYAITFESLENTSLV